VGVQDIAVQADLPADVELTNAEWALERRRALPPVVWFSLNAPKPPDFARRSLWREGMRFTLAVTAAPDAQSARSHGLMKRSGKRTNR
jgi:hypothetical protein